MIIVGHRGARNEAPENTTESFSHAQANGCLHFELDVQLSSDHELMVFHDTSLKRTTGVRGTLAKTPAAKLQKLDARRNTPGWPTPCHIPSLLDVVQSAPYTKHWQFEVKSDSRHRLTILARKLCAFIDQNHLNDLVTITSSDRWFLKHLNHHYPDCSRGYVAERAIPNPIDTALRHGCDYLCINRKLAKEKTIRTAQEKGLFVSCWTVNDLDEMEKLKAYHIDSVITDIPTKALTQYKNSTD